MNSHFFAMLARMKYINRWALMRNIQEESICQHSMETAAFAHALALIKNKYFGGSLNADRAAVLALYHDMPEIITGDLPTPVKYFNEDMKEVYSKVEENACTKLLSMLPEELKEDFSPLFFKEEKDEYLWKIVKAADKISALTKCLEEQKAGNREFDSALKGTEKAIRDMKMAEADYFLDTFLPSFSLTLDEQN
ncbi:MAG: 5'-deoxynucleotidase [Clostridia bacterium]|nr:5'-deoxynucleotidase [Clostridia bacterium]